MRSPEATSSASVSATSTTTSTAPARPPSVAPRAPCRSVSTRFARSAPAAGARPDSAPLPSDTASAKASTRQSSGTGPPSAMAGSHAAASVSRPRDRATPAAPPATASNALSAAELAEHLPAARAERGANRHLARSAGRADEQEIGDVRAGDQEHAADRHREQRERAAHASRRAVAERHQPNRRSQGRVGVARMASRVRPRDPAELGFALRRRRARREACERRQVARAGLDLPIGQRAGFVRTRHPHVGAGKRRRQIGAERADDGVRRAAEMNRRADDRRRPAEALDPEAVAEHGHVRAAPLVVHGNERASRRGTHADDVEERRGHARDRERLRPIDAGQVHRVVRHHRDAGQQSIARGGCRGRAGTKMARRPGRAPDSCATGRRVAADRRMAAAGRAPRSRG